MRGLPVKQRLAITGVAVTAPEDKVAGARKNAVSVIVELIVTHPYGLMYGGLLGMQEWEERYRGVMTEMQKMEKALDDTLSGGADTGATDKGKGEDECEEPSSSARSKKKKNQSPQGVIYCTQASF